MAERSKVAKLRRAINDSFRDHLGEAFKAEFGREIETSYNIFAMALVTTPKDGKKLTEKQYRWLKTYSDGYAAAMDQVQ